MLLENKQLNRDEILTHLINYVRRSDVAEWEKIAQVSDSVSISFDNTITLYGGKRVICVGCLFSNIIDANGRILFNDWFTYIDNCAMEDVVEVKQCGLKNLLLKDCSRFLLKNPVSYIDFFDTKYAIVASTYYNIIDSKGNFVFDEWYNRISIRFDFNDNAVIILEKNQKFNLTSIQHNFVPFFKTWFPDLITTSLRGYYKVEREDEKANIVSCDGKILSKIWGDWCSNSAFNYKGKQYFEICAQSSSNFVDLDSNYLFKEWFRDIEIIAKEKVWAKVVLNNGKENLLNDNGEKMLKSDFDYIISHGFDDPDSKYIFVMDYPDYPADSNNVKYNIIDYEGNLMLPKWVPSTDNNYSVLFRIVKNILPLNKETFYLLDFKKPKEEKPLNEERILDKEYVAKKYNQWHEKCFGTNNYIDLDFITFESYFNGLRIVNINHTFNIIGLNGEVYFDYWFKYIEKGNETTPSIVDVFIPNGKGHCKKNLLSPKGKMLLPHLVEEIWINTDSSTQNSVIMIVDQSNYNIVDNNGRILFDPWLSWIGDFHNGMAIVQRNGDLKNNIIDSNGKLLLDKWYDDTALAVIKNHAYVWIGNKMNLINLTTQKPISKLWFHNMQYNSELKIMIVSLNKLYNILKPNGNFLCKRWYYRIEVMNTNGVLGWVKTEGGYRYQEGDKYNIIDFNGNELLDEDVDEIGYWFDNGDTILEKKFEGKTYFSLVDNKGNKLIDWVDRYEKVYTMGSNRVRNRGQN